MRASRLSVAAGSLLVVAGSTVLLGWSRHNPDLIGLFFDRNGMPWSTAFGFVVAGLALIGTSVPAGRLSAVGTELLCALLVVLGCAALVGWIGFPGPDYGLSPLDAPNPLASSRMRPLTALGFIAVGLNLWAVRREEPRYGVMGPFLTLFVLLVGVMALAGPLSSLGAVYSWALGPVFSAGLGFLVASVGLLALHRAAPPCPEGDEGDDSRRIVLLAGAIVVVTGVVGIIGGFGVLYPQLIHELEQNLTISLNHRSGILQEAIRDAWNETDAFAMQPLRLGAMERISSRREARDDRDLLAQVAARAAGFGFSGVRFFNAAGEAVAGAGTFVRDPALSVPLHLASPSLLLWDDGYVLHTTVEMRSGSRVVGRLMAERRLPVPQAELQRDAAGRSVEFPVCTLTARGIDCFPFASSGGKVVRSAPPTYHGRLVPVAYAAAGGSGIARTYDYRGVAVIAAYGPVGDLGLVSAFKIAAAEFYQPVADRLRALFLLLLLVAAGAILLLRMQVLPLVRKMKREIEERKRTEERLQQSEARLTEITANLGEGVYVLDVNGAVTFVNPEAERLLGWSAAEMMGQDAHALFHFKRPDGSAIPEQYCPVHQCFRSGATYRSNDEWFVRKDGGFVPVALISSPILRDGRVQGSVASFVDVSEQKRIAEELGRHRDHLEQMVEERTGELRKLNHELEAFSYSVSHDLRAPLRAINGYSSALREDYGDLVPAEAHGYLDRMQAATIRMGELVDGLLNLSQVIRSDPTLVEVDLSGLAASIAASLQEAEPRRRVVCRIEPGVKATAAPALVRVLLENLFVNAWKFTAKRAEGRIDFGREEVTGESVFYVRDNGVGFDMQFAHKLFQPFERLHKHGEFAGNGIGLATVRRIAERHGGRVWATSGLDEGTTIHFTLGKAA